MRVVLFCGGLGLRMKALVEDNGQLRRRAADAPKPMIEVGGRPLLWHIMKWYAHHGHTEFVLCLGHAGEVIRDWFLSQNHGGVTLLDSSIPAVRVQLEGPDMQGWTVTLADTGPDALVGQRLRAVKEFVADQDRFLATYADGLSDVHLPDLLELSLEKDAVATFLAVPLASSLHAVTVGTTGFVNSIGPLESHDLWINGGFFVLQSEIFDYLHAGEELVVEPFARLIAENRLAALPYRGFWVALDTAKDRVRAEELWETTRPWAVWDRSLQPS